MGAPGMGKSPFAQKMIEGRRCFVFDINNEYGTKTKYAGQTPINLSTNVRDVRSRYVGWDVKQFSELAMQKLNTVILFEEATAFFRGKQAQLTSRIMIGRRHTKNVLVFLFHSINRVPPELMEMADIAVLFPTNDQPKTISRKYEMLIPHYEELRGKPSGTKIIIKML